MSRNREIDAFDTLVDVFSSYLARGLAWSGVLLAGAAMGRLGLWVNDLARALQLGPAEDFLAGVTLAKGWQAFVDLPSYWAALCLDHVFTPTGMLCLLVLFLASVTFITTDWRTELIFFTGLIVGPWGALALVSHIPIYALPLWVVWSGTWMIVAYKRSEDGEHCPIREEDKFYSAAGYHPLLLTALPDFRYVDPNPVAEPLRLPSTEELRASLKLSPPPPDIDAVKRW